MLIAHIAVTAGTAFIGAEFSWGKWNAEDVTGLQKPLMVIASRFGGYFCCFIRI